MQARRAEARQLSPAPVHRQDLEARRPRAALLQGRPAPAGEPHRAFQGNRPSSFFLFEELNPFALGQLMAIHEHRIFCQGVLWGIASFDQWGVELGKVMANELLPVLKGEGEMESGVDASTRALISKITA